MLKINIIFAIAYFVGGYLGTLISIPPSHASPIWPPAGIALAGLVTYHRQLVPGIWLGALLTQVYAFLDTSSSETIIFSLLIGIVASTAATAQAASGTWLIKRFVGLHNPLIDDRSILGFMALGGPISCMISATAGVLMLFLNGVVNLDSAPSSWITWWIGDTVGVLVFTPILLCFISPANSLWRLRIRSVAFLLILFSLLVLVTLQLGKQQEQKRIRSIFEERSHILHNALQNEITRCIEINRHIKSFFDSSDEVTAIEFKNFTESVLKDDANIKALEWIPRITANNRSFYEQQINTTLTRQAADKNSTITLIQPDSENFNIAYVEPYQGNERALGLNINSKPKSYEAIKKARDTASTTTSGLIHLIQDPENHPSFVIYSPVYLPQRSVMTQEERRESLMGIVANVIPVHKKFIGITNQFEHLQLLLRIADGNNVFFDETLEVPTPSLDFPKMEMKYPLRVADHTWQVTYVAAPEFYKLQLSWNIWWLILGGFLLTGLTGIGLLMLTGRTMQTKNLVKIRTRELELEIAERKAAEISTYRLSQLYALLSHCNQAIVRCTRKEDLFIEICRDAVRIGGMKMVWIGLIDTATGWVQPAASFGEGIEYLDDLNISIHPDKLGGQGPCGIAIRENRPVWCQDFLNDPLLAPWKERGAYYGWRALASLPINNNNVAIGGLTLYADKEDAFDTAVRDLLIEMALDIGFALENFDRETMRKQAELALQQSETRLNLAIKGSSDAPWDWDLDKNEMYYSPQWWRMLGYSVDELSSDSVVWQSLVHPADIDTIQQSLRSALESGQDTHSVEFRLQHKDGHYIPILERSFITRDKTGKVLRVSGTNMDLTERYRAQSLEDIRSFMLECMTSNMPLREILEAIALKLESLNPGTLCSMLLLDADGQHLRLGAAPSLPNFFNQATDGMLIGENIGCCGNAAFTGKSTASLDITKDPSCSDFKLLAEQAGIVSCWSEPILGLDNKVLGTFAMYQRRPILLDDHQIKLIMTASHYVSITIERKRIETQLKLAGKVFEQSNEGFMITDANRNIIKVNPAFTVISGYSEFEALGQKADLLSSGRHDQEFYSHIWESIGTQNYWQGEIWNRRKNGEVYPELLNISVVRDKTGAITEYVGVFADITQLKASEAQLEFLAHHDALTSLPNRVLLFFRLEHALDAAKRDNKQLALLMLDLDRFKDVNDSFGHLAGDQLLQLVANKLTTRLRDIDTVCRLGGDEFTVLLENISHPEDAARVAQGIISDLSEPWSLPNNREVIIGVSIGISLYPQHGNSPEILLQQADTALYKAKESGRNRFAYFSNEFTIAARERIELEARLRRAIPQNELQVYYQPQINIATGEIIGAEALVRWLDPSEGMIPPGRFIPVAEQTGLIMPIGAWVLRETCRQGRQWLDAGLKPLTLAVNVSPHQLRQSDINAQVASILLETAYPAKHLELELTESGLMERQTEIIELLNKLRAQGIRLAIDDFGTGYSSLAYLKRFPLDVLKIDKSFIDDIPHQKDDMEIAATIIAMGHILGFKVLAEGVETQEQLTFLQAQGCDYYQGYLKSRPLPAADFTALLQKSFPITNNLQLK